MSRKLFGTDGIRGLANRGDMTPEVAFRIGAAIAYQAGKRVEHVPRIVVGKDTRLSGYLFETAVASGICALGGEVLLSGPLPTPAIAHLTTSMRADAGVVISASHNPYQDNGIKIFGPDGFKLPDDIENEVEALIVGADLDKKRPTGTRVGRAERLDDAPGRYVAFVKASFPDELTLDGVKIVVDAAHGAAYKTAPLVFSELGATTHAIGVRPNGKNINHKVGALHPEACAKEVRKRGADLGIALDGDADRIIMIDEKGNQIDGDVIMALCATRMLRAKRLRRRTLVATVMSNLGLERAIENDNGKLLRCNVGDRHVVEAMRNDGRRPGGGDAGARHRASRRASAVRARRRGDGASSAGPGERDPPRSPSAGRPAQNDPRHRAREKGPRQERPRAGSLERHRTQAPRHDRRPQTRPHQSHGQRHRRRSQKRVQPRSLEQRSPVIAKRV